MARTFTGRHMAVILVAGFGVVIAVNLAMATVAKTTFGGVVVENSYVASQEFNGWLEKARASEALGWTVTAERREDGHVAVSLAGPQVPATVAGAARHPLGRLPDVKLRFVPQPGGGFLSTEPLPEGRWTLRLDVKSGADDWAGEQALP